MLSSHRTRSFPEKATLNILHHHHTNPECPPVYLRNRHASLYLPQPPCPFPQILSSATFSLLQSRSTCVRDATKERHPDRKRQATSQSSKRSPGLCPFLSSMWKEKKVFVNCLKRINKIKSLLAPLNSSLTPNSNHHPTLPHQLNEKEGQGPLRNQNIRIFQKEIQCSSSPTPSTYLSRNQETLGTGTRTDGDVCPLTTYAH